MKKLAILFATFVCFAMISGSFAATNQDIKKETNCVQVSQKMVIIVPSNPTTGCYWRSVFDHKYVKLVSKEYVPDKANMKGPYWVGYGGYDVYTFVGKLGQKITLKYIDTSDKVIKQRNYWIE